MPWTEEYRPNSFEEIKGQSEAVKAVKEFINNYPKKKKAIILHGPPGTGKTTLAYVIAKETNSEIFELNASDLRNRYKLKEILKPAIEQKSLIKKGKIILIEELLYLIDSANYPIIITANDIWDKRLNPLRKKSEVVKLKEINHHIIKDVMISILRKKNLFVNSNVLTSIAIRVKGDLRAAINDLQSVSRIRDPSLLTIDERNKETDIFNAPNSKDK